MSVFWVKFYGYLSQQQNMMQDYIRTATYQKAMLANLSDFKDKVCLTLGLFIDNPILILFI